jgi:replication initiation protein RepC
LDATIRLIHFDEFAAFESPNRMQGPRETSAEYGFQVEEWLTQRPGARDLSRVLRKVERPEEMGLGVESLERRQGSARERLESLLEKVESEARESVNSDPLGTENRPHQYTYNLNLNPEQDTVNAQEDGRRPYGEAVAPIVPPTQPEPPETGRVLKLAPDELVMLAPQLKSWLRSPEPTWPDVVDAAAFLRSDLGVSKSLWGEACLAMGREKAAIAIAIVSTKDKAHFRTSPGGYFHGMVVKAKAGQLNLDRTLWGMRKANEPRPQGKVNGGAGRGGDVRSGTRLGH